jgi:hypothetical protein
MEHDGNALDRARHGSCVAHVAVDQLDVMTHVLEVCRPARGEIVEDPNPVATSEEGVNDVRADEPGAARDDTGLCHTSRRA